MIFKKILSAVLITPDFNLGQSGVSLEFKYRGSVLRIRLLFALFRVTVASLALGFLLLDLLGLLEPPNGKIADVLIDEVRLAQRFSPLPAAALSALHSLLHYCQIHAFDVLYVVGLEAVPHEGRDLLVVGRDVQVLVEPFQEL